MKTYRKFISEAIKPKDIKLGKYTFKYNNQEHTVDLSTIEARPLDKTHLLKKAFPKK